MAEMLRVFEPCKLEAFRPVCGGRTSACRDRARNRALCVALFEQERVSSKVVNR
jgi:hypothetical protein